MKISSSAEEARKKVDPQLAADKSKAPAEITPAKLDPATESERLHESAKNFTQGSGKAHQDAQEASQSETVRETIKAETLRRQMDQTVKA